MIPQFIEGQAGALTQLNEIFEQLKRYFLFTRSIAESVNFTFVINGGRYAGVDVPDQTFTLPASATSYFDADTTTGTILMHAGPYTTGRQKIGIAVTNAEGLMSWQQDFVAVGGP